MPDYVLTHSFENLAQAYRVLAEAWMQLGRLIVVDRAEAIGNIEQATSAKLNAFHNLYDQMKQAGIREPDWYESPELCTLLAIRNARHHNKANGIRSLYNYHRYNADNAEASETYYYVNFASPEEDGGDFMDVPLSWGDLGEFLSLAQKESHLRPQATDLIREYLAYDKIRSAADLNGYPPERVFLNFVPLALNAGIRLQAAVRQHVQPDSTEATYFLHHFESVLPANTKEPIGTVIEFSLP